MSTPIRNKITHPLCAHFLILLMVCACKCTEPETGSSQSAPDLSSTAGLRPGLQLYTVRELLQKDWASTLDSIKRIGYSELEMAGTFGVSTDSIATLLSARDLHVSSMHYLLPMFRDSLHTIIEHAERLGAKQVVLAWINPDEHKSLQNYRDLASSLNAWGDTLCGRGLTLAYHNHDFEFMAINDTLPWDILINQTDSSAVSFELDLYWFAKAGGDFKQLFKEHGHRIGSIHLKDMGPTPDRHMMAVGHGTLNFVDILQSLQDGKQRIFFVEHDNPQTPLQSIRKSYDYCETVKIVDS